MNKIPLIFLFLSISLYGTTPQDYYNTIAKIQLSQANAYTSPHYPTTYPNDPANDPFNWQLDDQGNAVFTGGAETASPTTPTQPVGTGTVLSNNNDWQPNEDGSGFNHNFNMDGIFTTDSDGNVIPRGSEGDNNEFSTEIYEITQTSQVDQDNDVPTLLNILSKLNQIEYNTRQQTFAETATDLSDSIDTILQPYEPENLIPAVQDFFTSKDPTGSLPNLSFQVPSIKGGATTHQIDLNDPRFDTLFTVASVGLTSLFVYFSIKSTAWASAHLIGI